MSNNTLQTIGATAICIGVVRSIFIHWLEDWLEPPINKLIRWVGSKLQRVFVHSKRSYVIWVHSLRHELPTTDHNQKLFICKDPPCDVLHMSNQDTGLVPLGKEPLSK